MRRQYRKDSNALVLCNLELRQASSQMLEGVILLVDTTKKFRAFKLAGGRVKQKENSRTAVVNEVFEETDIRLTRRKVTEVGSYVVCNKSTPYPVTVYRARITKSQIPWWASGGTQTEGKLHVRYVPVDDIRYKRVAFLQAHRRHLEMLDISLARELFDV